MSSPSVHPIVAQLILGVMSRFVPGMSGQELRRISFGERIPHVQANRVLSLAVRLTGRADLGVLAAQAAEPGHFDLVEFAARTQGTLQEAIETIQRLLPVLHDGMDMRLELGRELSRVTLRLAPGMRLHAAGYDFMVASLLIAARRQTGEPELGLAKIELPYAAPSGEPALARLVRCPIEFDAPCMALEFASVGLGLPMLRADQSVGGPLRAMAERVARGTAERVRSALEQAVREQLRAQLARGELTAPTLARQLHVSERTLRRKLLAEGLSVRALLDDERREAALRLLADERTSTEQVASELGFSAAQAFHRAFRRWTGETVHSYRARRRDA